MKQLNKSMKQPAPRSRKKKEKKSSCRPKPRASGKVQKKTTKPKRPLQRNLRKKTPRASPSSSRMPNTAIRPTIFICYHKPSEKQNENEPRGNKKHWKIQTFQVTSCTASKCQAWARNLASSEAAVENWSNT
ncbi:unnamed protein product [Nyctereutes procyonoides]|uniref:(raccoon dog) hypothetical protein n=1 Tax=Nyctereutes procyonoides TaxID=34880 RepID=A0A811Z1D9_NYCPR|nr:unnamed protein product [Nyctereutes procyonoides]